MRKTLCTIFLLCFSSLVVFAQDMQQQFEGFNLVGYTDGGQKEWDINGETADVMGDKVEITNVDANAYGEEELNLKAKKGLVDKKTGEVKLRTDVVITSQSGATMKTDSLDWKKKEDQVFTKDEVTLEDDSMKIVGQGLEGSPNLKKAKLNSDVQADIETKSSQGNNKLTITSDGPMEMDQLAQKATFFDNVVAIETETGRKLEADKMQIYFNPETKKIKQIVCTGNVVVTQEGNKTYSQSLIYKAEEQRMILSGKPKLILDTESNGNAFEMAF